MTKVTEEMLDAGEHAYLMDSIAGSWSMRIGLRNAFNAMTAAQDSVQVDREFWEAIEHLATNNVPITPRQLLEMRKAILSTGGDYTELKE